MTWTSPGTSPVDKPMWTLENPGCLDSGQWMVHDLDISPGTSPVNKSIWILETPGCLDSGQWMVHDLDKPWYLSCRQAYVDTGDSWMLGQWSVDGT